MPEHPVTRGVKPRKLLLNAVQWTAKMDVPRNGVESELTAADLQANIDPLEFDDD